MTPLERITIVIEPPVVEPVGLYDPPRKRFEEFARALASHTSATVTVMEGDLEGAPTDGVILLYGGSNLHRWMEGSGPSANQRSALARIMFLQVDRASVLTMLEAFKCAGAIETYRFSQWENQRENESGRELYGLKSVAAALGARCWNEPFASANYCALDDFRFADLPALVVGYLQEYVKTLS